MSISDGRLHTTTSVYNIWIILAYQTRVSGITVSNRLLYTWWLLLPTDFTVTFYGYIS